MWFYKHADHSPGCYQGWQELRNYQRFGTFTVTVEDAKEYLYTYCNDALLRTAECLRHIQVTESMISPETRERELTPLKKIPDNYEKIVIAMNAGLEQDQEGIKIVSAIDFLLEE